MKTTTYLFMVGTLFLGGLACANAQSLSSDKGAARMLKTCYTVYNATCATAKGPSLHKKLDSLQQKYCTAYMVSKIKSMAPDFDLLGYNEYTDVAHLKTLKVTTDGGQENNYLVSYIERTTKNDTPVDVMIVIHVSVEQEADGFKIANIR